MKKLLALLLAFAMCFALVACGGNTEEESTTTTTTEDFFAEEDTTAEAAEDTTAQAAEDDTTAASAAEDTTAAAAEETTLAAGETAAETTAAAADMSKADFVKFLNAETAKIAKSGSYSLKRECDYTSPIDVGGATGILNGIISAIDENADLNSVVGGFIGIGTKEGKLPADKEKVDSDYQLKATAVTEADLASFSAKNGVYTFTLPAASYPQKDGKTAISRFTNDFFTHGEVAEGIASFNAPITLKESNVNYKDIKVQVTVADGKITNIKYAYAFDATLALKAGITINGNGAAVTKGEYSAIKY